MTLDLKNELTRLEELIRSTMEKIEVSEQKIEEMKILSEITQKNLETTKNELSKLDKLKKDV